MGVTKSQRAAIRRVARRIEDIRAGRDPAFKPDDPIDLAFCPLRVVHRDAPSSPASIRSVTSEISAASA